MRNTIGVRLIKTIITKATALGDKIEEIFSKMTGLGNLEKFQADIKEYDHKEGQDIRRRFKNMLNYEASNRTQKRITEYVREAIEGKSIKDVSFMYQMMVKDIIDLMDDASADMVCASSQRDNRLRESAILYHRSQLHDVRVDLEELENNIKRMTEKLCRLNERAYEAIVKIREDFETESRLPNESASAFENKAFCKIIDDIKNLQIGAKIEE